MPDHELLSGFAESRCEAVFSELAARYAGLVYSAAVRLVRDRHLAEDVTQAVFAALARDPARALRKVAAGAPLSAWLHVTTRNIAAQTIRTEERRRAREKEAVAMNETAASAAPQLWEEIAPELDTALASLRERDRTILLLRFFEGKSVRELALRFGAGEEAMQKRVSRAVEVLRRALLRRRVSVNAGALAGLLAANSVQAAPASVIALLPASALAAGAGAGSAGIIAASFKAMGTLVMTKPQIAGVAALLVALALPLSVQHLTLNELRAAEDRAPAAPPETSTQVEMASDESRERQEIEELRHRAATLRARLDAANTPATRSPEAERSTVGPVLLSQGKPVSLYELGYAGLGSPEAALQSFCAAAREADLSALLAISALPPRHAEKLNDALSSPETAESFADEMRKRLLGAVLSERLRKSEDGAVVEQGVTEVWPDNPSGTVSVEILKAEALDPKRVRIEAKFLRGEEARNETFTFGKTHSGWKYLWQ